MRLSASSRIGSGGVHGRAHDLVATPALAAAPSNDDRANAQVVHVPSTVTGTTVDATIQQGETRVRL